VRVPFVLFVCSLAAVVPLRARPAVRDQAASIQPPSGWPSRVPPPGTSLNEIERTFGHADSVGNVRPDLTELTYASGVRLRVQQTRGLAFAEFSGPWSQPIFGIQIDDPLPDSELDAFSRPPRFSRGVFVGLPAHPHWFVDVDDRVDAVRRLLFVDLNIYGPGIDVPGVR
jgi:transglutaminase-like putative cysteine protease